MENKRPSVAGMKVLLVDDTPANIDVLCKTLEEEKLNISMAPGGEIALKIVSRSAPDLILLDIMMPEMDGYETCRRLKANENTRHIPVIFISAKVDAEEIVKGFSSGSVDYIAKPFRRDEVLARVSAQLELVKLRREMEKLTEEIRLLKEKL